MYIYVSICILYSKLSEYIYILYACAFNVDKQKLFTVVQVLQKNCRVMALSLHWVFTLSFPLFFIAENTQAWVLGKVQLYFNQFEC